MQSAVTSVLSHFGIRPGRTEPLGGGLINPTFKIWVAGEPVCILQRLNTSIFSQPEALMENILQVLPMLNAPGYQATELLQTTNGKAWLSDSELGFWRAYRYIPHSRTYPNSYDPDTAAEAGRMLGMFHHLLRNLPPESLHTTLPGFHDLEKRAGELGRAIGHASHERKSAAEPWLALAAALIDSCRQIPLEEFPLRVCHNDPVMKNILFREDRPEALCLIDLDTLMPGYLIWDFGDAVRSVVCNLPEDHANWADLDIDVSQYAAFVRGFTTTGVSLNAAERHWLPHGLVLMPLLHGIRALADYLAGDVYYKTEYPDQNLNRARCLLRLAECALDRMGELRNA